jgi:hypothetical protein
VALEEAVSDLNTYGARASSVLSPVSFVLEEGETEMEAKSEVPERRGSLPRVPTAEEKARGQGGTSAAMGLP